jgi:hypothetical protein
MSSILSILSAFPWFAWIAIVAIVCGTCSTIFKQGIIHRERMAMIQHGINPDLPTEKPHSYANADV